VAAVEDVSATARVRGAALASFFVLHPQDDRSHRCNTRFVPSDRAEYLLLLDGLDDAALRSASRAALNLVADDMATAETDIPWAMRDTWPPEVAEAAARLRDRFVPGHQQEEPPPPLYAMAMSPSRAVLPRAAARATAWVSRGAG
jgi:hypothetical protein